MKKLFLLLSSVFRRPSQIVSLPPERRRQFDRWRKDNGDRTLRVEYTLDEQSIVFDAGGYRGDFAADINSRYNSHIYVFEPVSKFYKMIQKRFERNDKIKCFNFGFSDKETEEYLCLDNDGSSVFRKNKSNGENLEKIHLKNLREFMKENRIEFVDLLKSQEDIVKITDIQVQFHDINAHSKSRMDEIKKHLKKTHHLTYEYEFVWENWRLNS